MRKKLEYPPPPTPRPHMESIVQPILYALCDLSHIPIRKCGLLLNTRDVFYFRREVDLMKTAKVNAYIMHIFGKIELLSIHST